MGSACSTTGDSGTEASAVRAKIATSSPRRRCQAITRRVLNVRPSRIRSTA
jgi:hypothetical protein